LFGYNFILKQHGSTVGRGHLPIKVFYSLHNLSRIIPTDTGYIFEGIFYSQQHSFLLMKCHT